ncbi:hypothetical protein [Erythrobacter sp.]|uniref:hypothetical protein n=1 Tax=Erythrobacter sp. TaxID=1042 RepID=UPI001425E5A9|nr:hypothetical protein [Erythrobacter sp.]QIQ87224.1 MAG: hypothetical protein G9473_11395 [Erythrobacter sp.]
MARYGGDYSEPINPWLAVVLVSYAIAYFLQSVSVEWPDTCDIPSVRGVSFTGLIAQYACTDLLQGGLAEKLLFVLLWSAPAWIVGLSIRYRIQKARGGPGEAGRE